MSGASDYYSLFSDYLTNQKANSANTRESYLRDTLYFLEYLSQADMDPLEADEQVIQGYVDHLHDLKRSPTTISRNLASVRCFYKFLIFRGEMDHNPAKGIKLEKTVKKLPQVLSGEEIEQLLAQPDITEPKGCRDKAMLELLYATGIRASELINLNIQDLNLRSGVLYCRGSKGVRSIPVYPSAVVAVSDYIYRMRGLITGPESGNALFVNLNGGRLTRQGLCHRGRDHKRDHSSYTAALLCAPSSGKRCFRQGHSDHDGTCGYFFYTSLCSASGQPCKTGV